ncbi:hypothetical protein J5N97_005448 [Dioscorea zingiberensis]|uniref:Uncharacterized protein n=1 Tax=Dioscorea zingiberensis TaxID=325984 RepID=A0A9D5HT32_9LILI|nr:hypothetical protein J5N97_005448 [Dioscorea zingiberensis]
MESCESSEPICSIDLAKKADGLSDSVLKFPLQESDNSIGFNDMIQFGDEESELHSFVHSMQKLQLNSVREKYRSVKYTPESVEGPLPPFITTFTQLSEFNLSHNLISGPLPVFPGDGTYFSIDLSHNYLSGSIPSSLFFGVLTNPILDISFNKITGKIPGSLGKINFGWINMAHNKLTGDASFLFGESKWATLIDLSWNELQFNMSSLRFSTFLENLDLSHNEISGSIPKQIIKAKKLKALNLSYNQLCGRIPTGGPMAKFHSSSYVHNLCLCGRPLPPCRR